MNAYIKITKEMNEIGGRIEVFVPESELCSWEGDTARINTDKLESNGYKYFMYIENGGHLIFKKTNSDPYVIIKGRKFNRFGETIEEGAKE